MKLINGVIFGVGLGLIIAGLVGIADEYKPVLYAIGGLLVTIELVHIFFRLRKQS